MEKTEIKRKIIIEKIADHLLVHGIKGSSLRKIAEAVGMSDRMLLHYFVNKEEMMTAALTQITARLVRILKSVHLEPMPFQILLAQLAAMMKDPQVRPYLKISLELVALAAEKRESYGVIARKIWNDFFGWIAAAIQVKREKDRIPLAALAFATTEGFLLLDALGCDSIITEALEGIKIR
jgi:AcrR family transcriptional regulator